MLLTPQQLSQVKWIAESKPIPSHVVVVRKGLDTDRREAFKAALLKLNNPEYKYLLKYIYSPDGYVESNHEDYKSVEDMARLYGYLK